MCTSPPYWGLRDYGLGENGIGLERTPEEYVAQLVAVFREVWRVLRDDGIAWLNLGDCYHSGNRGGYRNDSHRWENCPIQSQAKGSHLEAVSPNRLPQNGLKDKDLVGIPWRVAFALQADGWYLRSDIIWAKPNPMPESVRDRPTKSHEYIFMLSRSERYYWDQEASKENVTGNAHPRGNGQNPKRQGAGKIGSRSNETFPAPCLVTSRNIRTVWTIPTQPYSGAHFATFPEEIPERCIKAGTKPGDVVLDPFCGSGTTVSVARRLGRVGIGLDLKYHELAAERVGGPLFAGVVNSAW